MSITGLEIDFFNVFTNISSSQPNIPSGNGTGAPLTTITQNLIQVLSQSSSGGFSDDGDLYVPQTSTDNGCTNLAPPEVVNASRNLPTVTYSKRIAFVPWTSNVTCVRALLLDAANRDVRAFITYLPDDSSAQPPDPSNQVWGVTFVSSGYGYASAGQGSFPIYAIPGHTGRYIMDSLSSYVAQYNNATATSNSTSPNNNGTTGQNPWIISHVTSAGSTGGLPGLWVIVLCVVGVFLAALILISLVTRIIQRRRRNDLRRRILTGEADLVVLGIKRVTVPEEILATFPLEKFHNVDDSTKESTTKASTKAAQQTQTTFKYAQSSCAICLDDYAEDTVVRILPCAHIFHPECVDSFLKENSSLCPICKRTVLPQGYCPAEVTNAMVRRDRAMRAGVERPLGAIVPAAANAVWRRHRGRAQPAREEPPSRDSEQGWTRLVVPRFVRRQRASESTQTDVEMQPTAPVTRPEPVTQEPAGATLTVPAPTSAPPARSASQDRQEWARRRAVEMVGGTPDGVEEEERREAQRPAWRKIVSKAFPSF